MFCNTTANIIDAMVMVGECVMTREELEKKLLDNGFPVVSRKRLPDNTGDQLFLGSGIVITLYDQGGYYISDIDNFVTVDTLNAIIMILEEGVVKKKEADIADFGGIIGVGV